jgi:hypothetical protein
MGDAAPKNCVICIAVIKMYWIVVGGDFGEYLNVAVCDNLAQVANHTNFDIFDTDRAAGDIVEHFTPKGNKELFLALYA